MCKWIAIIAFLGLTSVQADERISVLCRKLWSVDSTSVCLTPSFEKLILSEFSPEQLKENERIGQRELPADIEPVALLEAGERSELIAIQKSFTRFLKATSIPKDRIGVVESYKVLFGLKGYDCFSMASTVFRFLHWLEDKKALRFFRTTSNAWRGNPNVHVATPILRKRDRTIWMVDAWWEGGAPKIFSEKEFQKYTDQRLESAKPGPKF